MGAVRVENGWLPGVRLDALDDVSGDDLAFSLDAGVEASPTGRNHTLLEVWHAHADIKLVAGAARICDPQQDVNADPEQVADPDFILERPFVRQVFAELPERKLSAQLCLPPLVVRDRVQVQTFDAPPWTWWPLMTRVSA